MNNNLNYLDHLKVYYVKHKKRFGSNNDGGYVICDNIGPYDCYISAGVSNEESFSRDFIKANNMNRFNSYAFDGTIQNYPYNYTKDITFIKKNISSISDSNNANLSYLINNYKNIFLKMDIEGCEYEWINSLDDISLQKFKQIVIEFHNIYDDHNTKLEDKIKSFSKLSETHYLVHIHGNNYSGVNEYKIPSVIEATYIRKNVLNTYPELNKYHLPCILDRPNSTGNPDYDLNFKPFVNN